MHKTDRRKELYRRGQFWLAWDERADGSRRSPYPAIFWYDPERRRIRSASTGAAELEAAKAALDARYLEQSTGRAVCPTCHRPWEQQSGYFVSAAIADYLTGTVPGKPSEDAIRARLDHVLDYLEDKDLLATTCDQVDAPWIARFRSWAADQPIVSPKSGTKRQRSLSTIEGSVAQLSAAINDSFRRGNTASTARFRAIPIRQLNQTPSHRSDVAELAAMFRYCTAPDVAAELADGWGRRKGPYSRTEIVAVRLRERAALHRFLIASIATLGRPDAVLDISTEAKRRQWNSNARILDLNPKGRRQTRKYRAIVPVAWQAALHLDAAGNGFFVGPKSVRSAWEAMRAALGLPDEGEAGTKLLRRSMGDLLRQRLPEEAWGEISMFMGHDRTDPVTSLYAPFSPTYLRRALAEVERIIDEIEARAPGAFALPGGKVVTLGRKA